MDDIAGGAGAPLLSGAVPLGGGTAPIAVEAAPIEAAPLIEAPVAEAPVAPIEGAAEPAGEITEPTGEPEATPETVEPAAEPEPSFPTYEAWKLPEGFEMPDEQTSAFNNIIGKYGLAQDAGQELMDYGTAIMRQNQERFQAQMEQNQRDAFTKTRADWVKTFDKQAGNRRNTILQDAKTAIENAVPNEKARAELWHVLDYTGAGDNPAIINAFAALGKKTRERGAPSASLPTAVPTNPAERRYGRS